MLLLKLITNDEHKHCSTRLKNLKFCTEQHAKWLVLQYPLPKLEQFTHNLHPLQIKDLAHISLPTKPFITYGWYYRLTNIGGGLKHMRNCREQPTLSPRIQK